MRLTSEVDDKDAIAAALTDDFGSRSVKASLLFDVFTRVGSLKYAKAHLVEWLKPEQHEASFQNAVAEVVYQPKGVLESSAAGISPVSSLWRRLPAFSPAATAPHHDQAVGGDAGFFRLDGGTHRRLRHRSQMVEAEYMMRPPYGDAMRSFWLRRSVISERAVARSPS